MMTYLTAHVLLGLLLTFPVTKAACGPFALVASAPRDLISAPLTRGPAAGPNAGATPSATVTRVDRSRSTPFGRRTQNQTSHDTRLQATPSATPTPSGSSKTEPDPTPTLTGPTATERLDRTTAPTVSPATNLREGSFTPGIQTDAECRGGAEISVSPKTGFTVKAATWWATLILALVAGCLFVAVVCLPAVLPAWIARRLNPEAKDDWFKLSAFFFAGIAVAVVFVLIGSVARGCAPRTNGGAVSPVAAPPVSVSIVVACPSPRCPEIVTPPTLALRDSVVVCPTPDGSAPESLSHQQSPITRTPDVSAPPPTATWREQTHPTNGEPMNTTMAEQAAHLIDSVAHLIGASAPFAWPLVVLILASRYGRGLLKIVRRSIVPSGEQPPSEVDRPSPPPPVS
jgi:hypothetical protein